MQQEILEAIGRKDAETALRLARDAVAANPEDAEAQHALGLSLQLSGDHAAAAEAFDRAIALAPHTSRYHVARAALALGQRDAERADSEIRAALAADPNQLNAYVLAAHLAISRGDADDAERQLKLAQRVAPDHPVVIAIEGNLAQLRGEHEKAIKLLSSAAERMPEEPLVLASLGLAYLDAGHLAFAEQSLRRALDGQPNALRLRWALVEAKRRQGHLQDLPAELERILAQQPDDPRALALLGDCRLRMGEVDAALAAYRQLIGQRPLREVALDGVMRTLSQSGLHAQAVLLMDEQLERNSDADALWQRRVMLVQGDLEAAGSVLDRWQAALPDSLGQILVRAEYDEACGRAEAAEAGVDKVLAAQPGSSNAAGIKFRLLLRRDPQAALQMAEQFHARAGSPQAKRLTRTWQGFALDRVERHDEAGAIWLELAESAGQAQALPPIRTQRAEPAPSGKPQARLLWGPPGSRVAELVGMLRGVPDLHVLDDRFGPGPRQDGFGPWLADGRATPGARWYAELEMREIPPAQIIDWLPHWDISIDTALPESRLCAVLADPRDLLLNALVFGGPQPWPQPTPEALVDWLQAALGPLVDLPESRRLIVDSAQLVDGPDSVAQRVERFFDLQQTPPSEGIETSRRGVSDFPACFPPGHWRRYAKAFDQHFAPLAPLAERLGFEA
ncbi:tetratricopeptide repeat protein [Pseudomarimonas salicorniae]|uniref:Tetratricopeptide repeat protein n=1 Tax=Pseudomarimonas salicorniae TaxID=2933270 RepID=A0ABT0GD33_9GAMM|nr:tetratricopeptide repeat protein [Lysobacter sp. CAU 1642]MCK7592247.1 tetratricopeptide repeat protein [Lysobacter sp. CAU 1642]